MQHVYPGYFSMRKTIPYFKLVSDQLNQLKIAKKGKLKTIKNLQKTCNFQFSATCSK